MPYRPIDPSHIKVTSYVLSWVCPSCGLKTSSKAIPGNNFAKHILEIAQDGRCYPCYNGDAVTDLGSRHDPCS